MRVADLVLFAAAGWCGIGVVGVAISLVRGRRAEAARHSTSIATVAGIYLLILLVVSLIQQQRVVRIGEAQCFGEMCFTVTKVDEVPGLVVGDDSRVIRVMVQVVNRGGSAGADDSIRTYLADSQGRVWETLAGLSGNRLTARVAGGSEMVSEPMFQVGRESAGIGLVLTHGSWSWRRLVVGNSESLAHKRTVVSLGR